MSAPYREPGERPVEPEPKPRRKPLGPRTRSAFAVAAWAVFVPAVGTMCDAAEGQSLRVALAVVVAGVTFFVLISLISMGLE